MGIVKKDTNANIIRCLIQSSNILETVYNTETKDLLITFNGGRVYQYKNVSADIYNKFEQSESHGKTFHLFFKPMPAIRLNDVDPGKLLMEITGKV